MVVNHLVFVYFPTEDKTIDAELASTLLNTSGLKLTIELLRGAATCLKPGTFSAMLIYYYGTANWVILCTFFLVIYLEKLTCIIFRAGFLSGSFYLFFRIIFSSLP